MGYDFPPMAELKLSDTVLLPKTGFAMRGQLSKQEPVRLKAWEESGLYESVRAARVKAPPFFLHDGPPYANGNIHIGHALNKILKDIIVRYKLLRGYDAPYLPGWDCHGLPIELKALESGAAVDTKLKTRAACRAYAEKYVSIQRGEFRRLGVCGEFDKPYITMDPDYQADILEGLAALVDRGFVSRAEKPVLWCARCRTALAEAEVEYESAATPAVTVKFQLEREPHAFLLIWTTTPWTLPANLAVAVHPSATYLRATVGKEIWIVAEPLASAAGIAASSHVERAAGKDLVGLTYRHPWIDRTGSVFPAEFVTLDTGTGLVHIAPGHGKEDFQLGQKYKLPTFSPVDASGRLTGEAGEFAGRNVFDANPLIIDRLRRSNALVRHETMTHDYPHCWRCKQPLIFRATPQWFVNIDHDGLRQKMLEAIGRVRWFPAAGEKRIRGMVESRPDWCISRQRAWGVPIPAVHCESCGRAHLDGGIVRRVAAAVRKKTADIWFSDPPQTFLPEGWKCPSCRESRFRREEDILDVWFDSGMSHMAALERRYRAWPADLYLEGSDQHRGWFQVSLILGVALKGEAPFRQVLTHGFVMDGAGRKMSKSLGNVVTPQEVVEKHGADVLRLWAAGCDYSGDVRLGPVILSETVDTYRRIRNTIRFLLGNLSGFDAAGGVAPGDTDPLDRFILGRLSDVAASCLSAYDVYDFSAVIRRLKDFCDADLSGFYLDVLKDRLYCDAKDSKSRRSAQTALHHIAEQILSLASPILPFTAEETWEAWGRPGALALAEYKAWSMPKDAALDITMSRVLEIRKDVKLAMEAVRQEGRIGGSLDAQVVIRTSGGEWDALQPAAGRLAEYFIVSDCRLENSPGVREIRVEPASGEKCDRCWKYVESRVPAPGVAHGAVCSRCASVLHGFSVHARP